MLKRMVKALLLGAMLGALVSAAAHAAGPSVKVTRTRVTFSMTNASAYPMTCKGKLTAKTKAGKFIDAKVEETMRPGGEIELFITAEGDDLFADGWTDISCEAQPPPEEEAPEGED